MSIGFLALFFSAVFGSVCVICRPTDHPQQRVDCRPIHSVIHVDVPREEVLQ